MEVSDGSGFNEPVLNEVLSLNAQEFQQFAGGGMFSGPQ